MCNLSQEIREKGITQGKIESEIEIILNMYDNNFTLEQIAVATKKNMEEVNDIIKKREPALV